MTDKERHQLASYVRRVAKRIELGEYINVETTHETPLTPCGKTHTGHEALIIRYTNVTQVERARKKLEAAG